MNKNFSFGKFTLDCIICFGVIIASPFLSFYPMRWFLVFIQCNGLSLPIQYNGFLVFFQGNGFFDIIWIEPSIILWLALVNVVLFSIINIFYKFYKISLFFGFYFYDILCNIDMLFFQSREIKGFSMQYFVTIYIDAMKLKLDYMPFSIPHAFLGLTHTHPDELDKLGNIEIEKYDMPRYDSFTQSYCNAIKKEKGKWYEQIYPSILDSNFKNEGFFGFGPITHASNHWGKVYENNQYAAEEME